MEIDLSIQNGKSQAKNQDVSSIMYHSGIISGQKSGAGSNQGTRATEQELTFSLTHTTISLEFPHQVSLEEVVLLDIADLKILIYVRRGHLAVDRHRVSVSQGGGKTIGPIMGDRQLRRPACWSRH